MPSAAHEHPQAGTQTTFRVNGNIVAATLYPLKHIKVPPLHSHSRSEIRPGQLAKFFRTAESGHTVCSAGLVSRIFCAHYPSGRTEVFVHLHLAKKSSLSPEQPEQYFLQSNRCYTVPLRKVKSRSDKKASYVVENGVWRDSKARSGPQAYLPPARSDSWDADPFRNTTCDACLSRSQAVRDRTPVFLDGGAFEFGAETYHVGDAAFFARADGMRDVWDIGVILDRSVVGLNVAPRAVRSEVPGLVGVRICGRFTGMDTGGGYVSEREVYLTNTVEARYISDITAKAYLNIPGHRYSLICKHRLSGTVRRTDKISPDKLRPLSRDERPVCHECKADHEAEDASTLRLPSTDLYAGGGGSILGVSAHFEPTHAVDSDKKCTRTLLLNKEQFFPSLEVHECTVSELKNQHRGPKHGDVALLVAGPPCQGHSSANHHREAFNPGKIEVLTCVDEIARLRPTVAIIENVDGIKLDNDGRNYARETIAQLMLVGYQVRVGLLDSADYGSAQQRRRFIFLAVARGLPLPPFPHPTHANNSARMTRLHVDGKDLAWVLWPGHGSAAFPAVDAKAAIHDLGAWEYWSGPTRAPLPRAEQGAYTNLYNPGRHEVGAIPVPYAHSPRTDTQQRLRGECEVVLDHITGSRTPRELGEMATAPHAEDTTSRNRFRRTRPHGLACTLLTSSRPGGMATAPVHWECSRTFTVAERKRLQGFRDAYRFKDPGDDTVSVDDMDRMTGNAVNVDLAAALAWQVKRDVFVPTWLEMGRPDSAEFWRRWKARYPA